MRPRVEPISFEQSERGIVLLCKRRRDIPGDHHFYIIVGIFHSDRPIQILGTKIIVEIMAHQHGKTEANRIRVRRVQPAGDFLDELLVTAGENLRRERITDRPVIDEGQRPVRGGEAFLIIRDSADQPDVEQILLVKAMGKKFEKIRGLRRVNKAPGVFPELRRSHAENCFRRQRGNEPRLKRLVSRIGDGAKLLFQPPRQIGFRHDRYSFLRR